MKSKLVTLFFLTAILDNRVRAQDPLLRLLDDSISANARPSYVTGTFKATHIVNMQTVESPAAGSLNFLIQDPFGQLKSRAYNFFGLHNANPPLRLDFGITHRPHIGPGRS